MKSTWLVIEDNQFDAELIQRAIQQSFPEIRLEIEEEFEAALPLLQSKKADEAVSLIITDHNLPGITGLEGCQQLIQDGVDLPMILLTGNGREEIAVDALKSGVDDYIVKDTRASYLPLLVTVIKDVLNRHADRVARRQAQLELEHFAKELEIKNKELDAFAHTVAHDLRNPLGMVSAYLSLLNGELSDHSNELAQHYLQKAVQLTHKSVEIVDALLAFSLMSAEEVTISPVNIGDTIAHALERLDDKIKSSGAIISLQGDWPECLGYAPWIEEVWVNYIGNAIKYGGTPPHIGISFNPISDNSVCFFVTDNGCGLTEKQQRIIFDPFVRLTHHKDQDIQGTGLGLSIVTRIISRLGGGVGVHSQPNDGSAFYFTLPLSKDGSISSHPPIEAAIMA